MATLFLQARWVLPIDAPPIEGGVVAIVDGLIKSVGPRSTVSGTPRDLGDVVLLPGLVNAHTHLEFSSLDMPLGRPGMPLPDWIRLAIAERHRSGHDPQRAILTGLDECRRCGVTALGEIATAPLELYPAHQGQPVTSLFEEVIGFSAARVESVFSSIRKRIGNNARGQKQPPSPPELQHGLWSSRGPAPFSVAATYLTPMQPTYGISPHAPYTVHPLLLERLIDLAIDRELPIAMHLAESPEELQLLADGDGPFQELLEERSMWDPSAIAAGSRPLDYLQQLSRAPRALVIHGNYLTDEEITFLARYRHRMSVVYCPRTHAYFNHARYPLAEMLAAGVHVALGTDSRASNPDLSLLEEMRHVARNHLEVTPVEILRLGTIQAAAALGQKDIFGSITPGKRANLTTIPCDSNCNDPYEAVAYG